MSKNYTIIDETLTAPMVSVAMLTFNHASYIAKAIESALMQKTTFPIKLVIAEDCSTDNTREIVMAYQKKNPEKIKVILQNYNVGFQKNNKDLFSNLEGKYVAALEGDDYWIDPYKMQKQVDFLEAHPEYGMVHSDYHICYVPENVIEKNIHTHRKTNLIDDCFDRYWGMIGYRLAIKTLTVCFRTEYINKGLD